MNRILQSAVQSLSLNMSISPTPHPPPNLPVPLSYLTPLLLIPLLLLIHTLRQTPLYTFAIRALRNGPIPSHIAFIMDGNRRWAKRLSLPGYKGHPQGGDKLIQTLQWCLDAGVRTVTVYAFSIENFKRSQKEVDEIMSLAESKFFELSDRSKIIHQRRVRVRVLGDLSMLPTSLRTIMANVVADTASYVNGPVLNVCFAYTARHDIATAVADLVNQVQQRNLQPHHITQDTIEACLSTSFVKGGSDPCPQLLVRTSGETRLSDFLLWESAHSVLSFYPVLWPDLSAWNFVHILLRYQCIARGRNRKVQKTAFDDRVTTAFSNIAHQYFDKILQYCR